jgi:hypothetical protein
VVRKGVMREGVMREGVMRNGVEVGAASFQRLTPNALTP